MTEWLNNNKGPYPGGDGNFRLSSCFLEHGPVTLTTNQSEECHRLCSPQPKFCMLKNASLKTIRDFVSFELKLPNPLAWPYNKPWLLTSTFGLFHFTVHQAHRLVFGKALQFFSHGNSQDQFKAK